EIAYQPATKLCVYDYDGEVYHMHNTASDHLVTPNHTMLYYTEDGYAKEVLAEDFFITGTRLPVTGLVQRPDLVSDSDNAIRLLTWCVTDGHLSYIRQDGTYNTTYRAFEAMTDLKDYLPLPSTLQAGIFHTLCVYLSDGEDCQSPVRRYQTLWETLLTQNQAG